MMSSDKIVIKLTPNSCADYSKKVVEPDAEVLHGLEVLKALFFPELIRDEFDEEE